MEQKQQELIVLITDDEQGILDLLESELRELDKNIKIIKTNNGYDALHKIQNGHIDFLISDVSMPDMNGKELYNRVKQIRPQLPIIMMTGFGYDPNHTILDLKKLGLKHVIAKPFDTNRLLTMIYEMMNQSDIL